MERLLLILCVLIPVIIPAQPTLFSQEQEVIESDFDELAVVMTGLSPEQFAGIRNTIESAEQKIRKTMRDAGYTHVERDTLGDQLELFTTTLFSLSPEIETGIKTIIDNDEYRAVQERILIFSQFADLEQVTDFNELGAIASTLFELDIAFNPTALLDLTREQQIAYQDMQKDNLGDFFHFAVSMEEEVQQLLQTDETIVEWRKKIEKAESEEDIEKANALREQAEDVIQQRIMTVTDERLETKIRDILKKSKDSLQTILTPQQKEKLQALKENMPESLWKIMPGNYGKERPWRPGENSWQPGMGAPDNMNDSIREMRPKPKERDKRFPE